MKYKFVLSIGFPDAQRSEIVEFYDDGYGNNWSELTEEDKERILDSEYKEWSQNIIEGGWIEV